MDALLQYAGTDSDEEYCEERSPSSISSPATEPNCEIHGIHDATRPMATPTVSNVTDTTVINVDYFGMNDDSDSDAESKSEERHHGHQIMPQPAKGSSQKKRISNNNAIFSEPTKYPEVVKTAETNHIQVPDSDFWKKNSNKKHERWTHPELLWNSGRNVNDVYNTDKIPPKHQIQDQNFIHRYKTKRQRTLQESSSSLTTTIATRPLEKTCYYVHHKISPFLTQNTNNSVPKRKYCELDGHNSTVNRIQWCPHSYSHLLLSASMDQTVKVWNAFSSVSTCVQTLLCHTKAVKDAVWTSNGRNIISGSYDRTASLFDVENGKQVRSFQHDNFVTCVQCHPVNPNYFITGSLNVISCWDQRCATKTCNKYSYKEIFGQVQDLAFMSNGSQFLSCNDVVSRDSSDRNIMAWDFTSGVVISNQVFQERFTCTRLRIHPHEAQFIAQTQGDYMALFSTIKPFKMNKGKRYEGHKVLGYNIGCDFSPDGRYIASGSADGHLSLYDFNTSKCIRRLSTGRNVCLDVAWHPVLPSTVAMTTWGGKISLWS